MIFCMHIQWPVKPERKEFFYIRGKIIESSTEFWARNAVWSPKRFHRIFSFRLSFLGYWINFWQQIKYFSWWCYRDSEIYDFLTQLQFHLERNEIYGWKSRYIKKDKNHHQETLKLQLTEMNAPLDEHENANGVYHCAENAFEREKNVNTARKLHSNIILLFLASHLLFTSSAFHRAARSSAARTFPRTSSLFLILKFMIIAN